MADSASASKLTRPLSEGFMMTLPKTMRHADHGSGGGPEAIRIVEGPVPIPGADVQLNGSDLVSQGREEQKDLKTELKEMLESLTYSKILETEVAAADNLNKLLKYVPMPNGKAIVIG